MFDFTKPEFHVVKTGLFGVFPGSGDHFSGHINANHMAAFTYFVTGHERIEAGAGTEVQHRLAGLEASMFDWKSATEPQVCIGHVAADTVIGITDHVEISFSLLTGSTTGCAAPRKGRFYDSSIFLANYFA